MGGSSGGARGGPGWGGAGWEGLLGGVGDGLVWGRGEHGFVNLTMPLK